MEEDIQIQRKLLLTPCSSKLGLRNWLVLYLDIDLPDTIVDSDSTGSALDHLWELYYACITRDRSFPRRILLYAARAVYKTVILSLLELLAMLHCDRSCIHLAALEEQAQKAQQYLRNYLSREILEEFNIGNNKRTVAVAFAEHKTNGEILTEKEYKALNRGARRNYWHHSRYTKVIVNTMGSSNSEHQSLLLVDELDLMRFVNAYNEAKMIPEEQRGIKGDLQPPITLITSSRKFAGGLVQFEIDQAEKTGTAVWHWNILDATRRCPDERHRPDLPRVEVYTSDDDLRTISPKEYEDLVQINKKNAENYKPILAYAGCLKNCQIFAACKGRLATVTSKAGLLKSIEDTVGKFRDVSVELAKAQLMCWKPSNEAGIYRNFDKKKHTLTLSEMWEKITGELPNINISKQDLIDLLIQREVKWAAGVDWGFTHNFAVVLAAIEGRRAFIIDAFEVPQLELNQKIELCDLRIKKYDPVVWPDPAYPADIKTFRKSGYRMQTHTKDVLEGINAIRAKLNPFGGSEPELFMIRDDSAGDLVARRIEAYRWVLDAQGNPTDVPDDTEDDTCDALRYLIQNEFKTAGKTIVSPPEDPATSSKPVVLTYDNWMTNKINEFTGGQRAEEKRKIKKGRFFFDAT